MSVGIYFSRSFDAGDRGVYDVVRDAFNDPEVRSVTQLELFDSEPPTGAQLADKIIQDITRADIVVCLFTRRHRVGSADGGVPLGYTVPPFVGSEAALAHARGKRLILFIEDEVSRDEMGFVSALNLEAVQFARSEVTTTAFRRRVVNLIVARLTEFVSSARPAHRFVRYAINHTVYPSGYAMSHRKADVEVLEPEHIVHQFNVNPVVPETGDGKTRAKGSRSRRVDDRQVTGKGMSRASRVPLPTSAQLIRNGQKVQPFPERAFTAFSSPQPGVTFRPLSAPPTSPERRFRVDFPGTGTYHYEWIWGAPGTFEVSRALDWVWVVLSTHHVSQLDFFLRVHRDVPPRRPPVWTTVAAYASDSQFTDDDLKRKAQRGIRARESRPGPFFTCHQFSIGPLAQGTDLLVLF